MTRLAGPISLHRRALLVLGALGLPALSRAAQSGPARLVAWIEVSQAGRITEFRAMVAGGAPGEVSFEMSADVKSGGGRNRSRQAGKIRRADSESTTTLSRLGIAIAAGSGYAVTLTVRTADGTIAKAELGGAQSGITDL